MRTRSLDTLVRISKSESFAKVAEETNTTLSTISMQMKSLEQSLGVELFDRSFRPPKLTPLGRIVSKLAEKITTAEADLVSACSGSDELIGSFRIGFIATASVRLLPQFLLKASKEAPRAEFQLETALSQVLEARVLSGQLDAAIVTGTTEPESDLRYDVLRSERLVYALPERYYDSPLDVLSVKLPFLQFNPSSGIGKLIKAHMQNIIHDQSKEPIQLDSVEAIMECVNEGLGFTLLSQPDINRYAGEKTVLLDLETSRISRQLVLASAKTGSVSKDIDKLVLLFS
ncbi:MAG: LysR family transcriptional regulator [Pseudomonadota bacterium]